MREFYVSVDNGLDGAIGCVYGARPILRHMELVTAVKQIALVVPKKKKGKPAPKSDKPVPAGRMLSYRANHEKMRRLLTSLTSEMSIRLGDGGTMEELGPKILIVVEEPISNFAGKSSKSTIASTFSSFTIWQNIILDLQEEFRVHFTTVSPQKWQAQFWKAGSVEATTKELSVAYAKSIFEGHNFIPSAKSTTPHDGLADAVLIAEYGRRMGL
jgi:hypothetical protein